MTYPAEYVAYSVIHEALRGASVWGDGVFGDVAPAWGVRPYVIVSLVASNESDVRKYSDPVIIMQVKCVADDFETASKGAQAIANLLDDQGEQEGATLATDAGWHVLTVSKETGVYLRESNDGDEIYHMGHQYRLIMEAK